MNYPVYYFNFRRNIRLVHPVCTYLFMPPGYACCALWRWRSRWERFPSTAGWHRGAGAWFSWKKFGLSFFFGLKNHYLEIPWTKDNFQNWYVFETWHRIQIESLVVFEPIFFKWIWPQVDGGQEARRRWRSHLPRRQLRRRRRQQQRWGGTELW